MVTAMAQDSTISHPVAKAVSMWALFGISSWTDVAALLGCIYSALLIAEWVWKKVLRGIARRRGWIASPPTDTEMGKLR
jgi:hypothetical protein